MPANHVVNLAKLRLPLPITEAVEASHQEVDSNSEWSTSCSEGSDDGFPMPRSPGQQTPKSVRVLRHSQIANSRGDASLGERNGEVPPFARQLSAGSTISSRTTTWSSNLGDGDDSFDDVFPLSRQVSPMSEMSSRSTTWSSPGAPMSSRSVTLSSPGAQHYSLSSRMSMEHMKDMLETFGSRLASIENELQDPSGDLAKELTFEAKSQVDPACRTPTRVEHFGLLARQSGEEGKTPRGLDRFNMMAQKLAGRLDEIEEQLQMQGRMSGSENYEGSHTLEILSARVDLMEMLLRHQMSKRGEAELTPARSCSLPKFDSCSSFLLTAQDIELGEDEQSLLERTRVIAISSAGRTVMGAASGANVGVKAGGVIGAAIGVVPAVFTLGLSIPVFAMIGAGTGLCFGTGIGGTVGLLRGGVEGYASSGRAIGDPQDVA